MITTGNLELETAELIDKTSNEGYKIRIPIRKKHILYIALLVLVLIIIFIIYLITKSNETFKPGPWGSWPQNGGNKQGQKTIPAHINSIFSPDNIYNASKICEYEVSNNTHSLRGYISVDDNNRGYFGDYTGYLTCLDLNQCKVIWRVKLSEIIYSNHSKSNVISRNGVSLFTNSKGINGVLVSAPNHVRTEPTDGPFNPCWAVALNANDGSVMWKTNLSVLASNGVFDSMFCAVHGFVVDNKYAYGGMSSLCTDTQGSMRDAICLGVGKVFKIDIDNGILIDIWRTLPEHSPDVYTNFTLFDYYSGASTWNYGSVIDDYVIFGSGNVFSYPRYIGECLINNSTDYTIPFKNIPMNPCGENMSDQYAAWKCLEQGIHTDSFNILLKHSGNNSTMKHLKSIPLQGIDLWAWNCLLGNTERSDINCPNEKYKGPGLDIAAIASLEYNGTYYVVGMQKTGMLYMVDLETQNVVIAKKVFTFHYPWCIAVDQKSMISVVTSYDRDPTKYKLANGIDSCATGIIHGIDLKTGDTIWQFVHPFGIFGEICTNDTQYDDHIDLGAEKGGVCERSFDGSPINPINGTASENVVIPDIDDMNMEHIPYQQQNRFGYITIVNDMVFAPSLSGDVFILNLYNGQYIHRIQCDDYFDETRQRWGRNMIQHTGVTVTEDKIIFYCHGNSDGVRKPHVYSFGL